MVRPPCLAGLMFFVFIGLALVSGFVGLHPNARIMAKQRPDLAQRRPSYSLSRLTMQRRPEDRRRAGVSRLEPLTAMRMTMTRNKRLFGSVGNGGRMPEFLEQMKIAAAGGLVGLVTGICVLTFKLSISGLRSFTYEGPWSKVIDHLEQTMIDAGFELDLSSIPADINIEYAFYPLFGGILTSLLLLATKAAGLNNLGPPLSGQLEELNRGKSVVLPQFLLRECAAVSALGTGCSLGPEGPSVEIGVTVSRLASSLLGLDLNLRKVLAASGAAAGVSAGFNAPLTGVVFALEILLPSLYAADIAVAGQIAKEEEAASKQVYAEAGIRGSTQLAAQALIPAGGAAQVAGVSKATAGAVLTSAALACLVVRSGLVEEERFTVASYVLGGFFELPFYMTLGIFTGCVAAGFRSLTAKAKAFYAGKIRGLEFMARVPVEIRPVIGAGLCGVVATKYPSVLFFGYDTLNSLLAETWPYMDDTSRLLTLLALKVSLTASCVGSGLMGGVFAPSLFFGATVGAAYENVLHLGLGIDVGSTSSYATVGAAAVLASVFRAPVTGILLVFELTRNYDIVLPLISTVAIGTLTIDLIEDDSMDPTWGWWWAPKTPSQNPASRPPPQGVISVTNPNENLSAPPPPLPPLPPSAQEPPEVQLGGGLEGRSHAEAYPPPLPPLERSSER